MEMEMRRGEEGISRWESGSRQERFMSNRKLSAWVENPCHGDASWRATLGHLCLCLLSMRRGLTRTAGPRWGRGGRLSRRGRSRRRCRRSPRRRRRRRPPAARIRSASAASSVTSQELPRPRTMPIEPADQAEDDGFDQELPQDVAARAPTAMRRPISRVRSVTDTSMMFMMPTPPTTSEISATHSSSWSSAWWST